MRRKWKWIFIAPAAIVAIVLFIALGGELVKLLWNWLLPALFGWRLISFWQALGLLALCRILVGGWGGRGGPRPNFRRRMAGRWEKMTPEEREKFRERFQGRCGPFEPPSAETKA
jgi:hypothetical protein